MESIAERVGVAVANLTPDNVGYDDIVDFEDLVNFDA
jgi:hypothetical protein